MKRKMIITSLVLMISLVMTSFNVYAYASSASYIKDVYQFSNDFSIPVQENVKAYLDTKSIDYTNVNFNSSVFDPTSILSNSYQNVLTITNLSQIYDVVTYIPDNTEVALNGWHTYISSQFVNGPWVYSCVFQIEPTTDIAIVDSYIVSSEPFHYVWKYYETNVSTGAMYDRSDSFSSNAKFDGVVGGRYVYVDSQNQNSGLYTLAFSRGADVSSYQFPVLAFTDLPVYVSSTDGSSGFTSIDNFSFSSNNINFNYVFDNNEAIDPNVPEVDPENPIDASNKANAYHYLNFDMSSYYTGSKDSVIHNISLTFNDFVLQHLEYYTLYAKYQIEYQDSTMNSPVTFYYDSGVHEYDLLSWFTKNNMQNVPSKNLDIYLPFEHFKDGNGKKLSTYIIEMLNTETGVNSTYVDIGTVLEPLTYLFQSASPIYYITPKYEAFFKEFKIIGRVWLSDENSDTTSGVNISEHDYLNGKSVTTSQSNSTNYYPVPDGSNLPSSNIPINGGSSGNVASTGGSNINTYVNIQNPSLRNGFELTETQFGNVASILNTITDNVNNSGNSNQFWGVMKKTYEYIPAPIWTWILTAVGAICGGAVLKWYLSAAHRI